MNVIRYRKDIDGMRAFAVLAVFIYHLYPSLLKGGFIGVDVFFVISGYLITRILLREQQSHRFSFTQFYIRRIKRILPALFVVIFASTFVAIIALDVVSFRDFTRAGRYASAQISNFYFAKELNYFSAGNDLQPLLHTWSLAVEEQFYLLWPLLIFLCFRLKKGASSLRQPLLFALFIGVFIISLMGAAFLSENSPKYSFYMFYTRGWEFAIGGLIALDIIPAIKKRWLNELIALLAFMGLMASFVFLSAKQNLFLGGYLLPCLASALLIYTAKEVAGATWVSRFLSLKIFVGIGLISYSLYLWHWPLISFYKNITYVQNISLAVALIIVIFAFLLSLLSYHFIEKPFRHMKAKNTLVFMVAFGVMAFSALGMKALQKQYDAPWRVGDFEFGTLINAPECIDNKAGKLTYRKDCDKISPSKALLFGDSHAIHYYQPIKQWAAKNSYGFSYLQDNSCPLLLGYKGKVIGKKDKECSFAQSVLAERFLKDENVEVVFIALRYDRYYHDDKKFKNAMNYTMEAFKKHNKKLVILEQVPLLKLDPNKCVSQTMMKRFLGSAKSRECLKLLTDNFESEAIQKTRYAAMLAFINTLAARYDVMVFKAEDVITSSLDNNKLLYSDNNHLNNHGAEYIKPYIERFMNEQFSKGKPKP